MPTVPVVPAKFLLRRDTSANWTSTNPELQDGEPGYETDTGKMKIGKYATGTTTTLLRWTALPYIGSMPLSTPPSGLRVRSYNFQQDISIVISLGGEVIPTPYTVQILSGTNTIYSGTSIAPAIGGTTYTLTLANPNYFKTDETYSIEFRDNNGALLTWANVVYTPPNDFPNTLTVVAPRLDPLPPPLPEPELAVGETDVRARPYVVSYKTIGIDYTYSGPAIDVRFVVYSDPTTIFYQSDIVSIDRSESPIERTYNITVGTFYPSNSNYKIGIYKLNDTQIWSYESFYFLYLSILSFNIFSNNSFTVEFNNPLYGVVTDVSLLSKISGTTADIWSNGNRIEFNSPAILSTGITFSTDLTTSYIFAVTFRDNSSVRLERTYRTAISNDATCIIDSVNSVSVSLKLTNLDAFYVQTTVGGTTYRTSDQSVITGQGFNYVDISTRSFYGSLTFTPPITFLYGQPYTFKIISTSDSSIFKDISGGSLGNLVGLSTDPLDTENIDKYTPILNSTPSIVNSATTTNASDIVIPVNWRGGAVSPTISLLTELDAPIGAVIPSTITFPYTNSFVLRTIRVTTGPGIGLISNQNYKLRIQFSPGIYVDTAPVLYSNPNLQLVQFEGFTGVRVIQKLSGASQLVNIYICDSNGDAAVHVGYATITNTGPTATFVRFARSGSNVIQSYVHGIRYILGVDVGSPPATVYSNTLIPTYSPSTTTLQSIANIGNAITASWSSSSSFASDYRIFLTLKVNNSNDSYDALTVDNTSGALATDGTVDSGLMLSPIVASSTPTSKANITGAIYPMSYTSFVSNFTATVSGTLTSPNLFTYTVTGSTATITRMFGPTATTSLQITGLPNIFNRIIARGNITVTSPGATSVTFTTTVAGLSASSIAEVSGGTIVIPASSEFITQTVVEIDQASRFSADPPIYSFETKAEHSFNVGQYVTISGFTGVNQGFNMSGVIYRVPYLSGNDGFGNNNRNNRIFYIQKYDVAYISNSAAGQVGVTAVRTLNPNAYYYIAATQYGSNYYYSTGIPRLTFTTYSIEKTASGAPTVDFDTYRIDIDTLVGNTLINSSPRNREFTINGCSETILNGINFIGTGNSITSSKFGGFFFYHAGASIAGTNKTTTLASCFPVLVNTEVDHSQVLRYTRASVQSVSVNFTTLNSALVTVIREFQLAPYTVVIEEKTGSSYSPISNSTSVTDTSTTSIGTNVNLLPDNFFNIGSTYRALITLSPASGGTFDYDGNDIIYDYDRTVLKADTAAVLFTPFSSTSRPNSIRNRIFVSFPYKGPPALAWFKLFDSNDSTYSLPFSATSAISILSSPAQVTVTRTLTLDTFLVPNSNYIAAIYFNQTDSPTNSIIFTATNTFQYTPSTCSITVTNITPNSVTLSFNWSGYPLQSNPSITLQLPKTPPLVGYDPAPITFTNETVNFSGSSPGTSTSQTFTLSGSSTFDTSPGVIYRVLVDDFPDSRVTASVDFAASNLSVAIQNTGDSMFSDIGSDLGVLTFTGLCYALSNVTIRFTLFSYTSAAATTVTGTNTGVPIDSLTVNALASGVSFGTIIIPSVNLLFDTFYNVFYTATIADGTRVTGYIRPNAELYDPAGYDILVFAGQSNMVGYDWVGVSGDPQTGTDNYTYPSQGAGIPLRVIPFETSTPPRLILGGANNETANLLDPNGNSVGIMTEPSNNYSIVTAKGPFISSESSEPVRAANNPINIAYQFTKYYLNHEPSLVKSNRRVCIVFRPKGGSSFQALNQWTPTLSPSAGSTSSFTNKLVQAIKNVQTRKPNTPVGGYTCNRIRVMGWLQGESDGPDNGNIWATTYMGPMIKTIFENTNTPPKNAYFILGNIFYHYNALYRDWGNPGNAAIRALPDAMTKTVQLIKDIDTFPVVRNSANTGSTDVSKPSGTLAFYAKSVSSHGLHSMDDNVPSDVILTSGMVTIHYNARSLRIFGRRFFNAYLDLIGKGNQKYGEPSSLKGPSTLWYDTFKRTLNWYSTATSYDYRKNPVGYLLSATLTSFPDENVATIDTNKTYYAIFSEYASGSGYTYVPHSPAQTDTTITPNAEKFGIKSTNTVAELVVSGVNLSGLRYYGAAKTYVPISPGNVNITNITADAVAGGGTSITYRIGTHPLRVGSLITANVLSPNDQYSIIPSTSVTSITSNSVTVFITSNITPATINSPVGTVSYKDTRDITLDRKVLSAPLATFIEDLDKNWASWTGGSSIVFNIEPVWYNSVTSSHILGRSNISLSAPFFGTNWDTLGNIVNTATVLNTIVYLGVPTISSLWTNYNQNLVLHKGIYTDIPGSPSGRVIIGCGIVPGTYSAIPTRTINPGTSGTYSVIGINRINPSGLSSVAPSLTFGESYPTTISTDVYPDALSAWDPGSFTSNLSWSSGSEPNGTYGRGCLTNTLATANVDTIIFFSQARAILTSGYESGGTIATFIDTGGGFNRSASPTQACQFAAIAQPGSCLDPFIQAGATNPNTQAVPLHIALNVPSTSNLYYFSLVNTGTAISLRMRNILPNTTYTVNYWFSVMAYRVPFDVTKGATGSYPAPRRPAAAYTSGATGSSPYINTLTNPLPIRLVSHQVIANRKIFIVGTAGTELLITSNYAVIAINNKIYLTKNAGALSGFLSINTVYYVVSVNRDTLNSMALPLYLYRVKLSTGPGDPAITLPGTNVRGLSLDGKIVTGGTSSATINGFSGTTINLSSTSTLTSDSRFYLRTALGGRAVGYYYLRDPTLVPGTTTSYTATMSLTSGGDNLSLTGTQPSPAIIIDVLMSTYLQTQGVEYLRPDYPTVGDDSTTGQNIYFDAVSRSKSGQITNTSMMTWDGRWTRMSFSFTTPAYTYTDAFSSAYLNIGPLPSVRSFVTKTATLSTLSNINASTANEITFTTSVAHGLNVHDIINSIKFTETGTAYKYFEFDTPKRITAVTTSTPHTFKIINDYAFPLTGTSFPSNVSVSGAGPTITYLRNDYTVYEREYIDSSFNFAGFDLQIGSDRI